MTSALVYKAAESRDIGSIVTAIEFLNIFSRDFLKALSVFVDPKVSDSMILECFTMSQDESDALYAIEHIAKPKGSEAVKELARNIIGNKGIGILKKATK